MSYKFKDELEISSMIPGQAKSYRLGKKIFDFKKSYVMGILNVTPDSFSDGGKFFTKDNAINHGLRMIEQGAAFIDIGGESTRPGSRSISSEAEISRVIPVIEGIIKHEPEVVISIDTTKAKVASEALSCGANLVNDISGLTFDPKLSEVVNKYDAGLIIMHMKGNPETMQLKPFYDNVVEEVYSFLSVQSARAESAGIKKIFIDPGIGFGKRVEDNFKLIDNLNYFKKLTYPIVIGLSRKSFIGKTINLEIDDRDESSNALNAVAISKGARIIRTHNVELGVQTCKLLNEMIS